VVGLPCNSGPSPAVGCWKLSMTSIFVAMGPCRCSRSSVIAFSVADLTDPEGAKKLIGSDSAFDGWWDGSAHIHAHRSSEPRRGSARTLSGSPWRVGSGGGNRLATPRRQALLDVGLFATCASPGQRPVTLVSFSLAGYLMGVAHQFLQFVKG